MLHLHFSLIRTELVFQDHYKSKNSTPNKGQVSPYHCQYLFEFCPPNVHLNSLTTSCAPALFQMPSAVFHKWPSSLWPQNNLASLLSLQIIYEYSELHRLQQRSLPYDSLFSIPALVSWLQSIN